MLFAFESRHKSFSGLDINHRSAFAKQRSIANHRQANRTSATASLLPSPLRGGGGGGGATRTVRMKCVDSLRKIATSSRVATPHPNPPPQGGREREVSA